MDWIDLAEDRDRKRTLVNADETFHIVEGGGEFLN